MTEKITDVLATQKALQEENAELKARNDFLEAVCDSQENEVDEAIRNTAERCAELAKKHVYVPTIIEEIRREFGLDNQTL